MLWITATTHSLFLFCRVWITQAISRIVRRRMGLGSLINDNTNPRSIASAFRRRRASLLKAILAELPRPLSILDVGGEERFWVNSGLLSELEGVRVTLLNLHDPKVTIPGFSSVSGDARNLSQFGDNSFDLVVSNSVIEHVGDLSQQQRMAQEIMRVGRGHFVQTPARYFPLEPHFLFPFFWNLPERIRVALVKKYALGCYQAQGTDEAARRFLGNFTLLTEEQLKMLFPDSKLIKERFIGITKSFIACLLPRSIPPGAGEQ